MNTATSTTLQQQHLKGLRRTLAVYRETLTSSYTQNTPQLEQSHALLIPAVVISPAPSQISIPTSLGPSPLHIPQCSGNNYSVSPFIDILLFHK